MDAIITRGLRKSYGSKPVLHGLDLRVPAGSLFGFLGPNGAGKTTTIRILLGLLRATGGSAEILGRDVWRDGPRVRADVGYLPGDIRLYEHLTGRQILDFMNRARGGRSGPEIARLAQRFQLTLDQRVRKYSRGMKQKLGLIQAMMHRPAVLILDEPTIALDPLMRQVLYEELRNTTREGRTVLFSSHTLSEVEELCDHVAIMREGQLIEQDRIVTLQRRAVRRVDLRFERGSAIPPLPDGLHEITSNDSRLAGTWTGPVDALVEWMARCRIEDVAIGAPDLQDLFMTYYSDSVAEVVA
jgi:ABC-2 type transport system ATP-binding protein